MIDAKEVMRCCDNCLHFNGDYCMREWNNAEEEYRIIDRDAREPEDYCDDWEG